MNEKITRPLRPVKVGAQRSLDFIWICDTSGSMAGKRIESVNQAAENALDDMRSVAAANSGAKLSVRVLAFDEEVRWITPERTPVARFAWTPLQARPGRLSAVGPALVEVARQFENGTFEEPALAPVLVLLSDGFTLTLPGGPSLADGLAAIAAQRAGKVSLRFAVAIGAERSTDALVAFVGDEFASLRVLPASRTSELAMAMTYVSSVPIQLSSTPASGIAAPPKAATNDDDDWIA